MLIRLTEKTLEKAQQVFSGTWKQPVGTTRGDVRITGCDQTVRAAGFGHKKGGDVIAVTAGGSWAVLPGPPGKAGPQSTSALTVSGQPFAKQAVFMVVYLDPGLIAALHAADGTRLAELPGEFDLESAGKSFHDPTDQGKRCLLSDGDVHVIDFFDETDISYTATAPFDAGYPMEHDGFIWWVEWQTGSTSNPAPIRLMRAGLDLTDVTVIATKSASESGAFDSWGGHLSFGHDFTDLGVRVWLEWTDGELQKTKGFFLPYDGGLPAQGGSFEQFQGDRDQRSGIPIGPDVSLCGAAGTGPVEDALRAVQLWDANNAPSALWTAWFESPLAVDMALDVARKRVYLVTTAPGHRISTYTLGGSKLEDTAFDPLEPDVVGIYRFETPRPVEFAPEEEE